MTRRKPATATTGSSTLPRSDLHELIDLPPQAVASAVRLVTRAETMGLVRRPADFVFDAGRLLEAVLAIEHVGVGRGVDRRWSGPAATEALATLHEGLEGSPHPASEWPAMVELLGQPLVSRLTGAGETSIRRYAAGERTTPDDTAQRLHFVALVCADLLGAYNEFGVRRWFQRPRTTLGGRAPLEVLKEGWQPDDVPVRGVAELARSLTTMGAG